MADVVTTLVQRRSNGLRCDAEHPNVAHDLHPGAAVIHRLVPYHDLWGDGLCRHADGSHRGVVQPAYTD